MFRPGNLGHLGRLGLVAASRPGLVAQALAILAKYGGAANLYLPGVGAINGITAGNWLDSAGTVAATVDNPVGLAVSAGKAVGPELVTNGGFNSGTAGWSGVIYPATLSASGGELVVVRSAINGRAVTQVATTAGKTYQISGWIKKISGTSNADLCWAQNDYGGSASVIGSTSSASLTYFSIIVTVSVSLITVTVGGNGGVAGDSFGADNISVREINGAHLTQSTTANKPILRRGLVNRMLWGGDFTNAAWVKAGSATATNPATISMPTAPSSVAEFFTIEASVGTTATFACLLSGTGTITLGLARNGAGAYEDTLTKVTLTATSALFLVTHTIRNAGQTGFIAFISRQTGDTATSVSCPRAALFIGAVTAQQIIDAGGIPITTTAPASSTNGPFAWKFDGSNDSFSSTLVTGGSGWICSGVQLSADVLATVANAGEGNATTKGFWLANVPSNGLMLATSNGSVRAQSFAPRPALNTPVVVEAGWDSSSQFVSSHGFGTASCARSGDCSSGGETLRIGDYRLGGSPFNGTIGATIIMPTVLPTATERETLRRFIASLSGVAM